MDNLNSAYAKKLLAPYRILDLTTPSGFLCGKILGDLGADVIKIEKPGGDPSRRIGPAYHNQPDPEGNLRWLAFNTGKRGITLDIEKAAGKSIFLKMVENADFVLESFNPGYMEGLGLGYTDLSRINPRVILTSITPFGQTGPHSAYKATDLTCEAMGGLLHIVGDRDRPPVQVASEQSYCLAGAQAALASLIAHHWRRKSGRGQHVDVSIQEATMWALTYPLIYAHNSINFRRSGNYHEWAGRTRLRRMFPCKDGFVCTMLGVGIMVGPMQARLVAIMNREGIGLEMGSVDWGSMGFDVLDQETVDRWESFMAEYFLRHTKAELESISLRHNLHIVPVRDSREVLEFEQLTYRDYWTQLEYPHLDAAIIHPGSYFDSNIVSGRVTRRAPTIGEHNAEVYEQEMGLSPHDLRHLQEEGVI